VGVEIPVEKKFRVLVEISRASHFAWRDAVVRCCPDVDPGKIVDEMWAITGEQTGRAYLKHLDPAGDLAKQIASSIVWSSQCMGEDAWLEEGEKPGEYLVRHTACPWRDWHARRGLLAEDRPGCDRWFETAFHAVNEALGSKLRFETRSALPDGDDCCLRRIWVEKA
jgi:hypothetical protein